MTSVLKFSDVYSIPDALKRVLLPNNKMLPTVLGMRFPPICEDNANIPIDDYFCTSNDGACPVISLDLIRQTPVPPPDVVQHLKKACKKHFEEGRTTIRCAHLPHTDFADNRFDLYIVLLWEEFHTIHTRLALFRPVQGHIDHLQQSAEPSQRTLALNARDAFRQVPWNGDACGLTAIDQLAELFIMDGWLSSAHADALLGLIERNPDLPSGTQVLQHHHLWLLRHSFTSKQARPAWLDEIAACAIENGQTLVTVLSVGHGDSHFAGLAVDTKSSTIYFGDSFGGSIPHAYLEALDRWIGEAQIARGVPHTPFTVVGLPIGHQEDGWNCLLFAVNALRARLFIEPLMEHGQGDHCRVQAFIDLTLLRVSTDINFFLTLLTIAYYSHRNVLLSLPRKSAHSRLSPHRLLQHSNGSET
jgi:hypothetical protein